MSEELKLSVCPFCGGAANFGTWEREGIRTVSVNCTLCGAHASGLGMTGWDTAEKAAEMWNRRAESAELETLKESRTANQDCLTEAVKENVALKGKLRVAVEALERLQSDPGGMPYWRTLQDLLSEMNDTKHPMDWGGHLHERVVEMVGGLLGTEEAIAAIREKGER